MKKRTVVFLSLIMLSTAFIISISPSFARTVNSDEWSVELLPYQNAPPDSGEDLIFTEDGKTVIFKVNADNIYSVPISFKYDEPEIKSDGFKSEIRDNILYLTAEPEILSEKTVPKATVSFKVGEKLLSASFILEEDINLSGSLAEYPEYYDKNVPIKIVSGEDETAVGNFPAKTEYTIDNKRFLLYNKGSISIGSNKECIINLSKTDITEEDINISTNSQSVNIKYLKAPAFENDGIVILNNEEYELPINFLYGNISPEITISKLIFTDSNFKWEDDARVIWQSTENGKVSLLPNGAFPGTYKVNITWQKDFSVEKIFYIHSDIIG